MQRPMSPAKYRALATYFPKSATFQTWCSLFKRAKSPVCCIVWDDEVDEITFSLVGPSHAFQHIVVGFPQKANSGGNLGLFRRVPPECKRDQLECECE